MASLGQLFPDLAGKELFEAVTQFDSIAYRAVGELLKKHAMVEEYYRLQEGRHKGVGVHRILLRLCTDVYDGSWERTIAFYESCNDRRGLPHYEDITTTLLVTFAAIVLISAAKEVGSASVKALFTWFSNRHASKEASLAKLRGLYIGPITLVIIGTAVREEHRNNPHFGIDLQALDKRYGRLVELLRRDEWEASTEEGAETRDLIQDLNRLTARYFNDHQLTTEGTASELMDEIVHELAEALGQEWPEDDES